MNCRAHCGQYGFRPWISRLKASPKILRLLPMPWFQPPRPSPTSPRSVGRMFRLKTRIPLKFGKVEADGKNPPSFLRMWASVQTAKKSFLNSSDRRFRYPFINCTNCGPRYTIIKDIPYDRAATTMASFKMCPVCRKEYEDPADRRFHAQPNACWACGPVPALHDRKGEKIPCDDPVLKTVALLTQGEILAIKGLGGFHLCVDATNHSAVVRLRRRKHREQKPLARHGSEP